MINTYTQSCKTEGFHTVLSFEGVIGLISKIILFPPEKARFWRVSWSVFGGFLLFPLQTGEPI